MIDNKIYKSRTVYKYVQKPEWKENFISESKLLDYKVPYFEDYAYFREGDMICIGGTTGTGKSHVSLNIIKKFIEQGVHPYYISSEPGNRFSKIAMTLGLKEGQFSFCNHYSPEKLELEDNAVTIVDWLLPEIFSETANLYKIFARQLDKHGGLLYIFSQLNNDGNFYAGPMVQFFSAFSCKYLYTKSGNIIDNKNTYFHVIKARESKTGQQNIIIPTIFKDDNTVELRKT